ncbi:hypothetical protein C2G38_2213206 [Gigaspora rosea]|uniref:Uncharacterized protein n=1 Tax=Gigaspora rosea TaxID=44941 RepID=A0A397UC66_9GLOM|nr:hypothetical protein C2G38_2213206 [Gigaspora rosea]
MIKTRTKETTEQVNVNTGIKKREIKWDSKSNEEGFTEIANYLFGIEFVMDEEGFPDIKHTNNFKDNEIKIFMKVLKKLVEKGEGLKTQHQNKIKEGKIVQWEEKTTSFYSGLMHLNKYTYPIFSKKYIEWIVRKKAFKMFKKQMQDVRDENKMLKRKLADKNDLKENESDSSKSDCDTDKPRTDSSENNIECENKGAKLYLMKFGIMLDERYLQKCQILGIFILMAEILEEKFDFILHQMVQVSEGGKHLLSFNGFKVLIDFKLVKDVIEKKNTSIIQIVDMLGELHKEFYWNLKLVL